MFVCRVCAPSMLLFKAYLLASTVSNGDTSWFMTRASQDSDSFLRIASRAVDVGVNFNQIIQHPNVLHIGVNGRWWFLQNMLSCSVLQGHVMVRINEATGRV